MNTDGGMICECPEGFVLSQNGMKCIDIREDFCYDAYRRGDNLNCISILYVLTFLFRNLYYKMSNMYLCYQSYD